MKQIIFIGVITAVIIVVIVLSTTLSSPIKQKDSEIASNITNQYQDSISNKAEDWSQVESQPFFMDIEKMNIVLIKRSFNEGSEATLIRYQNGTDEYFACSREIHEELVSKFKEIIDKRDLDR